MKNRSTIPLFFTMLVLLTSLAGCTLPQGSPDTGLPVNETAVAIGIALNDSSVRTYLTGPWTIMEVNLNAETTFAGGGEEVTLHTPDVEIDMESRVVHVYVDLDNQSVISIEDYPKRVPMP
jgi:hypothetical protein